ncbi:RDD family protein [Paraburkholderia sp. 2C]
MHYASWTKRARALFIDSIWWTVIVLFVPLGPSLDDLMAAGNPGATLLIWAAIGQCIPIVVTGILWAIWGTSPGKRATRLRIVDADTGDAMTVKQAALRTLGYLLTFATGGTGFLWVPFNPRKQALHDRLANTVVIDVSGHDRPQAGNLKQ